MTPLEKFYTDDPRWYEKIGEIHALLERVKISEEQANPVNDPVNDSVNVGVNVGRGKSSICQTVSFTELQVRCTTTAWMLPLRRDAYDKSDYSPCG